MAEPLKQIQDNEYANFIKNYKALLKIGFPDISIDKEFIDDLSTSMVEQVFGRKKLDDGQLVRLEGLKTGLRKLAALNKLIGRVNIGIVKEENFSPDELDCLGKLKIRLIDFLTPSSSSKDKFRRIDAMDKFKIDGLPSSEIVVERSDKVNELFDLVSTKGSVLVISPPFTGKTCILNIFVQTFSYCAVSVSLARAPNFISLEELKEYINRNLYVSPDFMYKEDMYKSSDKLSLCFSKEKNIILLVDDAQLIYHIAAFWGYIKDTIEFSPRLLAFATYGSSTGLGSNTTPIGIGQYLYFEFTKFKREEVIEFVEKFKSHKHYNACLTPNIIDEIQVMTNFHPGLTVFCIAAVLYDLPKQCLPHPDSEYNEQVVNDLISTGQLYKLIKTTLTNRVFRTIDTVTEFARAKDKNNEETEKANGSPRVKRRSSADREISANIKKLFHTLIYQKYVPDSGEEFKFEREVLLKYGICVKDVVNSHICFTCPLISLFYQTDYFMTCEAIVSNYDMPKNIQKFMFDVISRFNHQVLKNSISKMAGGKLNEAAYQQEFYRVAMSLYRVSGNRGTISASVGGWFGILAALDLYINSDFQFGFEFLVNGRGISEHVRRFKERYARIPIKASAVIDFYEYQTKEQCKQAFARARFTDPVYYRVGFFDNFQGFIIKNQNTLVEF